MTREKETRQKGTDWKGTGGKETGVLVFLPGARIGHATYRVETVKVSDKEWFILLHVVTDNAEREGTTAILHKYRQLVWKLNQALVGQIILSFLPVSGMQVSGIWKL